MKDSGPQANHEHPADQNGRVCAGTHLIIDIFDARRLDDIAHIEQCLRDCVTACGATLLHLHCHKFAPQGVTGVAILAESHMSFHTWPETGYAAFDVFMCGTSDPWKAIDVLKAAFDSDTLTIKELRRGDIGA